jgi:hypothetical protein
VRDPVRYDDAFHVAVVRVSTNRAPGNLAAGDDNVFLMMRDKCYEYDATTGSVKNAHELPESKRNSGTHQWGFVAYENGTLYGTATIVKPLDAALRRRGQKPDDLTDVIFVIDATSGRHLWEHQGQNIAHHTIAIGPHRVFYIDSSISKDEREGIGPKHTKQDVAGAVKAIRKSRKPGLQDLTAYPGFRIYC